MGPRFLDEVVVCAREARQIVHHLPTQQDGHRPRGDEKEIRTRHAVAIVALDVGLGDPAEVVRDSSPVPC